MRRFGTGIGLAFSVLALPVAGQTTQQEPYRHAVVATDHLVASRAGLEMLKRGGNAVDAAVAASFCLSVVRPDSCGLGGGGFMLIYIPARGEDPPRAVALNYRETAPAAVGPDYYVGLDDDMAGRDGVHAVGVPGTVAGLLTALERYGTLDRATVLDPARRAAERGVAADAYHVSTAAELIKRFDRNPRAREIAAPIWTRLVLEGEVAVGDVIEHQEQARALRLIAEEGRAAFYEGPIADAIVAVMEANGGPVTLQDLAGYTVSASSPLRGSFQGRDVLTMPPPSSGGIAMLQVFGILERRLGEIEAPGPGASPYVHLLTEAMKHAFADRAAWLADAAFVEVPVKRLLSATYLDERAVAISMDGTFPPAHYGTAESGLEDGGTSHISVVDETGMAVACSETINLAYGSLVTVPGFGFALNNEMDDFTTIPGRPNAFGLRQSDRNLPEVGKRPLSSMSPTIVLENGRPIIVAGGAGGPRIIAGTLQCILNSLLFDMEPTDAVGAPRFHHQWLPDVLQFEQGWTVEQTLADMEALGHETARREYVGKIQLIRADGGTIRAASDRRKGGVPAGY